MVRPSLRPPLTPFVDALPLPPRILADHHRGKLTVPIRAATHRFHRDLPTSRV
jgi:spore coat protein A